MRSLPLNLSTRIESDWLVNLLEGMKCQIIPRDAMNSSMYSSMSLRQEKCYTTPKSKLSRNEIPSHCKRCSEYYLLVLATEKVHCSEVKILLE